MPDPAYQVVYGVSLLDDIHNYFPALLYDQGRFYNIDTIFSYVRHQLNTRFNLYSYGASLAARNVPPIQQVNVRRGSIPIPPSTQGIEEDILSSMDSISFLMSLMSPRTPTSARNSLRNQHTEDIWRTFNTPVIVAASQAVLATNTQIIGGNTLPSNTICTVCQDVILHSDSCRRLTPCEHIYHMQCIDRWFSSSVFCPTCRHDIRDSTLRSPRLRFTQPANATNAANAANATNAANAANAPEDFEL